MIHIVCVSVCEQSSCVKCANTSERSVIALLERCQSKDPMGPSTLSNTICMLCSTLPLQHRSRVDSRSHPCPSNPRQGNQNWTLQAHLGHNSALSNNLMHLMHKLRGVCVCTSVSKCDEVTTEVSCQPLVLIFVWPARAPRRVCVHSVSCQKGFKAHRGWVSLLRGN